MTLVLDDPDFKLWNGNVEEMLRCLPDASVDCVVTSPPYWGLRDYGTAEWDGGDDGCDHKPERVARADRPKGGLLGGTDTINAQDGGVGAYRNLCGRCGAVRRDYQLGLEETPQAFVDRIVAIMREVRRVLADHGSLWLNLGDSYNTQQAGNKSPSGFSQTRPSRVSGNGDQETVKHGRGLIGGLKPKDLVGIPWRVAFALQADGWWLRSDIIWAKPNPMPESVTDRPTKAHEYVFLLTKSARYFFDQDAVREPATWDRWSSKQTAPKYDGRSREKASALGREWSEDELERYRESGRNVRSVWDIATQPYADAHFATFPLELPRRCIAAGTSEAGVCPECRRPWERDKDNAEWVSSCDHGLDSVPAVVLDPFMGSGTTAFVARQLGRHAVGVELNQDYCGLIAKRMQQLSLLA